MMIALEFAAYAGIRKGIVCIYRPNRQYGSVHMYVVLAKYEVHVCTHSRGYNTIRVHAQIRMYIDVCWFIVCSQEPDAGDSFKPSMIQKCNAMRYSGAYMYINK